MHYGPTTFVKAGANFTMLPREGPAADMGSDNMFTPGDIAWVNRFYGCHCHYLGNDLPGATPYRDWLNSKLEEDKFRALRPDSSPCPERRLLDRRSTNTEITW
ncbi:uncharacterized protein LOC122259052 [Penaeus japonicus]|uniref:uncharacterized protein LOC122259052 n=1 Tax=Penaeus japonicus TaxID=27405 RepID=UPI001C7129C1|nr:uncharacterized protein LOC122259052 [Penaeus japonicus]